jgi:signal peptidase
MKVLKKIATVVVSILLWAVILLAALYAVTTLATRDGNSVSNIAGFTPMIVETESMSPTFDAGDLIFIKTCNTSDLTENDIITFHTIINNEYALNTHRIVEITEENGIRNYVTKGDNNEVSDTHIISDGDIVGKYIGRLPKVGKLMNILSSSAGFLIILVLPMLLFFIYQVYHLIMVSINLKRAIAEEEAAKQNEQQEDIEKKRAEAEATLEEARRLKAEAEAKLAEAESQKKDEDE